MAECDIAVMGFCQRDEAAGAPIACGKAGFGLQRRDFSFKGNERVELEGFLCIPAIRQMRHQRAEQTAACPGTDKPPFDKLDGQARTVREKRGPEPHDPATGNEEVHGRLTGGLPAIIGICHG